MNDHMTDQQFNQLCANYIKDCLEQGMNNVDPPDDMELLDIYIEQPLANKQAELVLQLAHGAELRLRIDIA